MSAWTVLVAIAGGLLLLWLALLCTLWIFNRDNDDPATMQESVRLLPDVIRLLRALVADPGLPRGVRVRVGLLLLYLLMPIDLIPDFLPVIGYLDDAIIVAVVLRSVVRRAGPTALERHWPGTAKGLATVARLAGLTTTMPNSMRPPS